jgi:hypothetical protein
MLPMKIVLAVASLFLFAGCSGDVRAEGSGGGAPAANMAQPAKAGGSCCAEGGCCSDAKAAPAKAEGCCDGETGKSACCLECVDEPAAKPAAKTGNQ